MTPSGVLLGVTKPSLRGGFGCAFGEDVAGGVEAVERGGEARVDSQLDHQLDKLLLGLSLYGGLKRNAETRSVLVA